MSAPRRAEGQRVRNRVIWLMARLGSRLMRPYLNRVYEHYTILSQQPNYEAAHNCEYIAIGVGYACKPRRRYLVEDAHDLLLAKQREAVNG